MATDSRYSQCLPELYKFTDKIKRCMKFSIHLKRAFDFTLALCIILLSVVPGLLIALCIKLTSTGPVLFWSNRVGKNNELFRMPKFRTMRTDAPIVATHLMGDPDNYVTGIGRVLRKSSLDELPQLISIVKGDMSLVGPRPALFNQKDLIELRTEKGIHKLTPGLTGWAQINGRDELSIVAKVGFDHFYLLHQSFTLDLKIILETALKVILRDGVSH
jgi:O-antigen biosynthesis protein WbqP